MWPDRVVLLPPSLREYLHLPQVVKNLSVQQLVPELPVEALTVPVLPRTSWLYVQSLCSHPWQPFSDCLRRKFRPVV